jgi:hypothetical protein
MILLRVLRMNAKEFKLLFRPGSVDAEAVPAAGQAVYLDLTPGTMTELATDSNGKLIPKAGGKPVDLDESRTYKIVVTPTRLPLPPPASQGDSVQVKSGKILVAPRIAIKLTMGGKTPVTSLDCVLKVGPKAVNLRSDGAGWVISNDPTPGAVTIGSASKTLKAMSASPLSPSLKVDADEDGPGLGYDTEAGGLKRGDTVTFRAVQPPGTVEFKVTEWAYDISHTNPGNSIASTATVNRPAREDPSTFDSGWTGVVCAAGKVRFKWVVGALVRPQGAAAVSTTVLVVDPQEMGASVGVADRGGSDWVSGLTQNAEGSIRKEIHEFEDTGVHAWDTTKDTKLTPAGPLDKGPNRGCKYVQSAAVTFVSSPKINADLLDTNSAFCKAQTNIDPAKLLAGTRRHEYRDPDASHKANCLKARRALEPVGFIEAEVKMPGLKDDLAALFKERIQAVIDAGSTHKVVDEAKTKTSGSLTFKANQEILGVNVDDNGNRLGNVFDPKRNANIMH